VLLLRPLRNGAVALLWSGLSLSALGDQLYAVALVWVAVGVFGPAAGYLTALQAGCGLLAALFTGRWADRWDRRRAMAGADLARASILLVLVGAWLLRGAPPAAGLAAAIIVLATGEAVFRPALAALLPTLQPDRSILPAANALFDTTDRTARLVGPGLVGVLGGVIPVVHFFTLDAASFLASAAAVLSIRPRATPVRPARGALLGGFAVVRQHRVLGTALWLSAPGNGLWFSGLYLALPLLIEQHGITGPGGSGLAAFGLCVSAYGCTNLATTLVVGARPLPARVAPMIFSGKVLVGLGITGLALGSAAGLPGLMLAAAVAAIGGPLGDIPLAVLRQTELPQGEIAAATRTFMTMSYLGTLTAMLLAPSIASWIGPVWLLAGCGAGMMSLAALAFTHVRR
jgi:DHA3 family macrolide efflux protein-like MFS transporter